MGALGQQEIFESLMTSFGYKLVAIKKEWFTQDKDKCMDFCASDCKIKTCTRNLNNKFFKNLQKKEEYPRFSFQDFSKDCYSYKGEADGNSN